MSEMSPEFYAIIGVGISLAGFVTGLLIFFNNQVNKRFDRLENRADRMEDRFDRLEAKFDQLDDKHEQLMQAIHSLDLRVSKLEWMLEAALHGSPVLLRPGALRPEMSANPQPGRHPAYEKAAAKRRLRRRRRNIASGQSESAN